MHTYGDSEKSKKIGEKSKKSDEKSREGGDKSRIGGFSMIFHRSGGFFVDF